MNALDTTRVIVTLANASLIAFNGLFPALVGLTSPLQALPFLALASALLVGALLAEERGQMPLFWLFSTACLTAGLGF